MFTLNEKHYAIIKNLCAQVFKNSNVTVLLFGSRARGDFRVSSDIDLAVLSDMSLKTELSLLRELFEESTIPYEIDVVEFNDVVEELKGSINKEGIIIWKN
jgi:predicted nucleotidyltransferase